MENKNRKMWKIYDHTDIIANDLLKVSGLGMPCPSPVSLKYAEQNVESIRTKCLHGSSIQVGCCYHWIAEG